MRLISRRGQVTIFFAIGLVLLIIILMIIYVSGVIKDQHPEDDLHNPLTDPTAKKYIESCIDASFTDAVAEIGRQGGSFLSPELDGMSVSFATVDGTEMAVAVVNDGVVTEPPPKLEDLNDTGYAYESTLFGTIIAPRLCSNTGPNARNQVQNQHCVVYAYPNPFIPSPVIQESLQRKLTEDIEDCLAQSSAQEKIVLPIDALGNPELEIILADRSVRVTLEFPDADIEGLREAPRFVHVFNIRLKLLYEYMIERLVRNTRDPRHRIADDPASSFFRQGFSVTRRQIAGFTLYQFIDADARYSVAGSPLALSALVQDRPPFYNDNNDPHTSTPVDPDE